MKRQLISTRMIRKGAILRLVWISFLGCLTQLLVNGFINFYHAISRGKTNCKIHAKKLQKFHAESSKYLQKDLFLVSPKLHRDYSGEKQVIVSPSANNIPFSHQEV